jgi:hypothetical protein
VLALDEDSEDEDISMAEEASHRFEEVKEDPKSKKTEGMSRYRMNEAQTDR